MFGLNLLVLLLEELLMPPDISTPRAVLTAQAGVCTRSLMGDGCTVARSPSRWRVFTVAGISGAHTHARTSADCPQCVCFCGLASRTCARANGGFKASARVPLSSANLTSVAVLGRGGDIAR